MKTASVSAVVRAMGPAAVVTAACLLAAAGGCQKKAKDVTRGEDFRPEGEKRAVHRFAEAQAASAARADATLRAVHFNGPELNSLGRARLDLMLKDDEPVEPLVVYVDVPAGYPLGDRWRASATRFLKDRGLTDEQIRFESGVNPGRTSPAEDAVRGLHKLRSSPSGGGASDEGGAGGPAPSAGGAGI